MRKARGAYMFEVAGHRCPGGDRMDNKSIAQLLGETADLWRLRQETLFVSAPTGGPPKQ